jgi:hypothetical protein
MIISGKQLVSAAIFIFLIAMTNGRAQEHKLEVGGFYTALNLSEIGSTERGIGGRMSYNINDYLAVEGEFSFFPEAHLGNSSIDQKALGLIGVKAGARNRWAGIFAKARPGAIQFPSLKVRRGICIPDPPSTSCNRSERSGNRFAFDLGGVVEIYPAERAVMRIDFGDTMIRFDDDTYFLFPTPVRLDGWTHNFQLSVSLGFRF